MLQAEFIPRNATLARASRSESAIVRHRGPHWTSPRWDHSTMVLILAITFVWTVLGFRELHDVLLRRLLDSTIWTPILATFRPVPNPRNVVNGASRRILLTMILLVGVEETHSPTCVVCQNSELLDDDSPHHHARSTLEVFVDGRTIALWYVWYYTSGREYCRGLFTWNDHRSWSWSVG
jgi:hypothetical protein